MDTELRGTTRDGNRRANLRRYDAREHCLRIQFCRLSVWILCCLPFALLAPAAAFAAPGDAPTFKLPPGVVIDHISKQTETYIGSPSIAILPNGDYVSSHDLFGPKSNQSTSGETEVFRSRDRGRTWTKVAVLHDQFWSNLFVLHRKLYLMGSSHEYGRVVIRQSVDGGATWTAPSFLTSGSGYHTAPVPMIEKDGRIWRAMEFHPTGPWGHFKAFMLSAPKNANLLDPKSWSMTEQLSYPTDETEGNTWLEGNAAIGPDGSILDILRVNDIQKVAILKDDGLRLDFEGLVDFPGGATKFTIRYDKVSRRYWTLSNPAMKQYPLSATNPASVRNTLALMSSKDLHHWKIERIVLSHPDPKMYAFQYVDWQFDGPDIIAVSRTAFDDSTGGPHRFHDANYLTFHRIVNFRTENKAASQQVP